MYLLFEIPDSVLIVIGIIIFIYNSKKIDTSDMNEEMLIANNDSNNIIGLVVPDGDSFNSCIKKGYEDIFSSMLDLGEKELRPLFDKEEDGTYKEFLHHRTH